MSLGRPQVAHIGGVHVTLKGRVYYYRRRLPRPLRGEVGVSLNTSHYREAEWLASCLDAKLPDLLRLPVTSRDLGPILRAYLDELRASYAERHRSTPATHSMFHPVGPDEDPVDVDLESIDDQIGDHREAIGRRNWGRVRHIVADLMEANGIPEERRVELAEGVMAADIAALTELRERLLGRGLLSGGAANERQLSSPVAAGLPVEPAGAPLSEVEDVFLAAMQRKKVKPWPDDEVRKARSVYKLFREWCDDKPLAAYKRSEVYDFYRALAHLPRNHGKSPADRERTMQERIGVAAEQGEVTRLTAKTMEGYATRLIAMFEHHKDEDNVNWSNPAAGFTKWEELGEGSMSRAMWQGESLITLLEAPVWTGCSTEERPRTSGRNIFANERYWLPVLALYSGARLEELARLVRSEVREEDGIVYVLITDDEPMGADGEPLARKARVKSSAAVRRVPLHPALLDLGFMEYVRHEAPRPDDFLFPRLKADPKNANKRSGKFSQWFTAYRRDVGVDDPRYVFHSFRAGVATKLLSSPGVGIGNIVALIGHECDIAKATKTQTLLGNYLKADQMPRMSPPELAALVENGLRKLGMGIDPTARKRIIKLARGLPHYAHLLALYATRSAIDKKSQQVTSESVEQALQRALTGTQQSVLSAYETAIRSARKDNLFAMVLLACALADTNELGEFAAQDVRDKLQQVAGRRYEIPSFAQHLKEFTEAKRGPVLHKTGIPRLFRYKFIDPLLQPYVIMQGVKAGLIKLSDLD